MVKHSKIPFPCYYIFFFLFLWLQRENRDHRGSVVLTLFFVVPALLSLLCSTNGGGDVEDEKS